MLRARRRSSWQADLASAEDEVAWFARRLVPDLLKAGSREAAAGGWTVGGEPRVARVEDRLTALEASAPDETLALRALDLRDAVRSARERVAAVVATGTDEALAPELDEVAAELEHALAEEGTFSGHSGEPT